MTFDINKIEEKILEFWKNNKIFEKSLVFRKSPSTKLGTSPSTFFRTAKDKLPWNKSKSFVFFEGPPTANGRPGMHHFIGRAFKDLICRYKTMRGFYVLRKAGWDTHGLPVEIEVEKELGLKNKKEIEEYGIAKFNAKAKESVWKYKDEWERFTRRMGFWIDLKTPYVTYDKNYIESLWWIIKQIAKKNLLYKGYKVLPWCSRCGTALSSHEVAQGYKNITENSVYVKFKLLPDQRFGEFITGENAYVLSWTTTPWTLPGNVALAVGENITYAAVRIDGLKELLIIAQDLINKVLLGHDIELVHTFNGRELLGLEYEPLFDIPALKSDKSFKVYGADFVTIQDGTGIVHTAVMYGEDDYSLGEKNGLPKHHTVNEEGLFTDDVPEFSGRFVKEAEGDIINYLNNKNLLFKVEPYAHDYPFCWRCGIPLIYYAKDSWFVAMSKLRKDLLKNNQRINWVPDHLKEGRFGEFLKEAKDWAFSRERFWGTPLPIWECECGSRNVIGSYQELQDNAYRKPNSYYYMRHGESTKNRDNIMSSRLENDTYPLTEEGRALVKIEAKKIKKEGGVDLIFSSPFLRAKESAEIVANVLGIDIKIDNRLHEIDHGSMCEGQTRYVCLPENSTPTLDTKFGDGESWMDIRRRTADLLNELNYKHEGKKILLVGHGDPLIILEAITEQKSDQELLHIISPFEKNHEEKRKEYPRKGKIKKLNYIYGSYDEFGYINPHRPYIDEVFLKCQKCDGKMTRVKEVVDVWFDSGAMPYAQWHYPFSAEGGENKKMFESQFPADFIAEGIDQTRGWFYTLLAISTLLGKEAPYKNVVSYGHVLDEKGKKMSKSLGNVVDPSDVINKFGADAARWYFYTINDPGDPKSFSTKDLGGKLHGFIGTLWNSLRFFELYLQNKEVKFETHPGPQNILDKWALSRLNTVIKLTTQSLDNYDITNAAREIESFMTKDFSNWWIRRSRDRFQKSKSFSELSYSLSFLRYLLLQISKLIAPFIPFIAEEIHLELHKGSAPGTLSVHLHDWPEANKKFIDLELENKMAGIRDLVALGLAHRKEKNIKVRQPLRSIKIKTRIDKDLVVYLKEEVNVKNVIYDPDQKEEVLLDTELTQDLLIEGYVRELIRKIQDMRKEAGYHFNQKVFAKWYSENEEMKESIKRFEEKIKKDTLLSSFENSLDRQHSFDIQNEFEIVPGQKIWIGIWSK